LANRGFASVVRRTLHELLVHFLLLGIALFVLYALFTTPVDQRGLRVLNSQPKT
jgi:hypothetical protein